MRQRLKKEMEFVDLEISHYDEAARLGEKTLQVGRDALEVGRRAIDTERESLPASTKAVELCNRKVGLIGQMSLAGNQFSYLSLIFGRD